MGSRLRKERRVEGKRFCTLQLIVKCQNGDKSKLFCGQPKPEVCFRGQGLRISEKEKAAWHPDVWVVFQPKAWYDDAMCLQYAKVRMPVITKEAREAGRESMVFLDNLHGQTTDEYREELWIHSMTKSRLLPPGVTDLIQLIDAGFGFLVKYYFGEFHAEWLSEAGNLDLRVAGLAAWERRVHITHMLAKGYSKACEEFDFEKNAAKVGMMITIDGSGDELINEVATN